MVADTPTAEVPKWLAAIEAAQPVPVEKQFAAWMATNYPNADAALFEQMFAACKFGVTLPGASEPVQRQRFEDHIRSLDKRTLFVERYPKDKTPRSGQYKQSEIQSLWEGWWAHAQAHLA